MPTLIYPNPSHYKSANNGLNSNSKDSKNITKNLQGDNKDSRWQSLQYISFTPKTVSLYLEPGTVANYNDFTKTFAKPITKTYTALQKATEIKKYN